MRHGDLFPDDDTPDLGSFNEVAERLRRRWNKPSTPAKTKKRARPRLPRAELEAAQKIKRRRRRKKLFPYCCWTNPNLAARPSKYIHVREIDYEAEET